MFGTYFLYQSHLNNNYFVTGIFYELKDFKKVQKIIFQRRKDAQRTGR